MFPSSKQQSLSDSLSQSQIVDVDGVNKNLFGAHQLTAKSLKVRPCNKFSGYVRTEPQGSDIKTFDELSIANTKTVKGRTDTSPYGASVNPDNTVKLGNKDGNEGLAPQLGSEDKLASHKPNFKGDQTPKSHLDLLCDKSSVTQNVLDQQRRRISSSWPSTTLKAREMFPDFCAMYECIKEYELPNFLGARLPVKSDLIIHKWEELLHSYHDEELVLFLKYGWPVGYNADHPPSSADSNHQSAIRYPNHVNSFIAKEIKHNAIVGPFSEPPFTPWCRVSPLMTQPKKESQERRIIMDLSFPHGQSPNDGIDTSDHLGKDISYSLPSVADLITKLQTQGPGSWIWKADLSIRIDPLDTPLLGFKAEDDFYLDLCPSFGCKSSSSACQRIANAVTFIMGKKDHFVLGYLDDYAGTHLKQEEALKSYNDFTQVMDELGLKLASHKCLPPSQEIEWLGFRVNTVQMTISIPDLKLEEVVKECSKWLAKKRANRKMIQSILGKLIYISACVNQGRKFVSRILQTLPAMGSRNWTWIDNEFRRDIEWFQKYAAVSNGVHLYSIARPSIVIECDSSTTGAGGNSGSYCYSWKYSEGHMKKFAVIHQLEAVNVVVAFKTLAHLHDINSAIVTIFTDNSASSHALQSGKTKDSVLASCSRQLWLEAARSDHEIVILHKPGVELVLLDALSRRFLDPTKAALADSIIQTESLTIVSPCLDNYVFFNIDL